MLSLLPLFLILNLFASESDRIVRIGEEIRLKKTSHLFIENGAILKATEGTNTFNITAKKLGTTYIHWGKQKIKVDVLDTRDFAYYQSLKQAIYGKRDLQLSFNGSCSVISGRLLVWQDYLDIAQDLYGKKNHKCSNSFIFQAKLDLPNEEIKKGLEKIFSSYNLNLPAYSTKPHLILHAEASSSLNHFGLQWNQSKNNLDIEANIETEIFVLEVKKSAMHKIGISWPDRMDFNGSKLKLDGESLAASVHALEGSGSASILASPRIRTASNKEGRFMAGGEIPIKASGFQFSKVTWKSYGIKLNVKPKADNEGNIYLDLEIEVSMPDYANSVDGVPGLLKNTIDSQFFIKNQEYLVLSGLIKKDQGSSKSGLPTLQRIPVLGLLFSSESYQNSESELVVLVRPKVEKL